MMKTALVLGGGGSRGAYEIGAWKALRELNIDFDIVTGTSIGALIGAMIVQDRYEDAYDLWYNITAADVTADGIDTSFSIENIMNQSNNLGRILKSYISEKGADVTPLKGIIHRYLDYDRFIKSPIQFGLVTTLFPSLERQEITKDGMPEELIEKQILASASCFPAFPITEIEGKLYIDGGYCDNVPVDLAVRLGAERLIVIDLHDDNVAHNHLFQFPNVTFIHPSRNLGTILDFDTDLIHRNIELGYIDTLKAFGRFEGFTYAFYPEAKSKPMFMNDLMKSNAIMALSRSYDENAFVNILSEHTHGRKLNEIDFDYRVCEVLAELLDLPHESVYTVSQMNEIFLDFYHNDTKFTYRDFFKQLTKDKLLTERKSYLVGYIYYQLKNSDTPFDDLKYVSYILPREALCALYLYLLDLTD